MQYDTTGASNHYNCGLITTRIFFSGSILKLTSSLITNPTSPAANSDIINNVMLQHKQLCCQHRRTMTRDDRVIMMRGRKSNQLFNLLNCTLETCRRKIFIIFHSQKFFSLLKFHNFSVRRLILFIGWKLADGSSVFLARNLINFVGVDGSLFRQVFSMIIQLLSENARGSFIAGPRLSHFHTLPSGCEWIKRGLDGEYRLAIFWLFGW